MVDNGYKVKILLKILGVDYIIEGFWWKSLYLVRVILFYVWNKGVFVFENIYFWSKELFICMWICFIMLIK